VDVSRSIPIVTQTTADHGWVDLARATPAGVEFRAAARRGLEMRPTRHELARYLTPHATRHNLTRRTLLKAGAASTALIATIGVFSTQSAAKSARPSPVPANPAFGGLHIYGVDPAMEPSAITDFHGHVGAAVVDGTGTWKVEGKTPETLLFDTDMRFMQGVFRGTDGRRHRGTFAFV
jgi:hypothetical protein